VVPRPPPFENLFYTSLLDPGPVFPFQPNHVQTTSSSTPSLINVSFDFFNPNPKVDYHALTRLLSQLFSRDVERLQIPSLVELILAQLRVGTTIKTGDAGGEEEEEEGEEEEGDLYAVLSVVNVNVDLQRGNGGERAVVEYVLGKAAEAEARGAGEGVGLCEELKRLLTNGQGQGQEKERHVGFVRGWLICLCRLSRRCRMLADEIDGALKYVRSPSPSFSHPH
jgi:protein BCP1